MARVGRTLARVPVRVSWVLFGALAATLVPAALLVWASAGVEILERGVFGGPPVAIGDVAAARPGFAVVIGVTTNDRDRGAGGLRLVDVAYRSGNGGDVELGVNLMPNGDGAAGDATNFSEFTYVPGAGPDGQPAFTTEASFGVLSDELIPVDTRHTYTMSAWSRAEPHTGGQHFVGYASFDADGLLIEPYHVRYVAGSETELAADLAPGDTEIELADASGWLNGNEAGAFHNVVMYPYVDGTGVEHDPYTYSRHVEEVRGQRGLWGPGAIADGAITLDEPWERPNPDRADGVWPAGTKVANARSGAGHNYVLAAGDAYTGEWVEHTGTISGVAQRGFIPPQQFRPGTAFVKFAVLPNRGSVGSVALYSDIRLVDESAAVYRADPGFTGTDTFSYTIEDADGERASASVVVAVVPNADPVANADAVRTGRGQPVDVDVLANDTDRDGDTLQLVEVRYDSGNGARVGVDPNLMPNGDGAAGAANFSEFEFVADAGPGGTGAFRTDATLPVTSDEPIPVDTGHAYEMSAWSKADPNPGAVQWVGFSSYDADGELILPHHVRYEASTETTLAADLAPGDTVIRLEDAEGWLDGPQASHFRNIVMYPYVSPSGIEYEPYTYSRHTERVDAEGLWPVGGIEGDVITLNAAWDRPNPGRSDGVWPAGTEVANARLGPTHNYVLAGQRPYTSEWVEHTATISGVASGGFTPPDQFRPGTAYVKFVAFPNQRARGESVAWYAGIELRDLDLRPVVYVPAPGFTGEDTFTYVVDDGHGGVSEGTVTVTVGS